MTTTNSDKYSSTTVLTGDDQLRERLQAHPPVIVLGVMQRCGSGFLSDLLLGHPNLQAPETLREDYLMESAHLLREYVDKTYVRWRGFPWIAKPEDCRDGLLRRLSDGILELLMTQIADDRRLLVKTTAASNVDKLLQFFPEAKLLIVIRDGRDAVESAALKSPTESYEFWMQQWGEGARSVLRFMQVFGNMRGKSWELIRYEDLLARPAAVVSDLLKFLELDSSNFDWDRIEKSADLKPTGRWSHWGWSRKRAFKRIAGKELISLGYASKDRW